MQMRIPDHYYDVFPKVLRVGRPNLITIIQLFDNMAFKPGAKYSFDWAEMESGRHCEIIPDIDGRRITFTVTPDMEQEFFLVVSEALPNKDEQSFGAPRYFTEFHFYAVEDDLAALRPWKGDFHVHSCRSDGKDSPLYAASAYRQAGFDFFALTDHFRMPPSLEVIEGMKQLDTDFKVYPGEEVHPPKTLTHHVNFGGSFSVNELAKQPSFDAEVAEIEKTITHPWLQGEDKTSYAVSLWVFKKIREAGGVSIFSHPYWIWKSVYNVNENILKAAFADRAFDAFELIGGFFKSDLVPNSLQVARWYEEQAKGRCIPVVGVSDSHGTETGKLFSWYYTIVFAPTAEFPDLRDAIRNAKSLAVSEVSGEDTVQIHGSFRLVKYAYFLERDVLPLHDAECREEGRLMMKYFGGDTSVAPRIAAYKGAIPALYDKLFAK